MQVQPRHCIAAPGTPGGDGDMVGPDGENILGGQRAVAVDVDVRQGGKLAGAVVGDAAPGREAGEQAFLGHAAAEGGRGLGACCLVGYIVDGLTQSGWLGLATALACLVAVMLAIRARVPVADE